MVDERHGIHALGIPQIKSNRRRRDSLSRAEGKGDGHGNDIGSGISRILRGWRDEREPSQILAVPQICESM